MKALILIADGFDDLQLFCPYYRLLEEGVAVTIASPRGRPAVGLRGLPPLLRSGLVLTGANRVTDPKAPAAVADDGWLTAEEVAQMDLRGTEHVKMQVRVGPD